MRLVGNNKPTFLFSARVGNLDDLAQVSLNKLSLEELMQGFRYLERLFPNWRTRSNEDRSDAAKKIISNIETRIKEITESLDQHLRR